MKIVDKSIYLPLREILESIESGSRPKGGVSGIVLLQTEMDKRPSRVR